MLLFVLRYRDQLETNMMVTVVAIGTNDIISTYPLPQPCGFSLQLNQDYMTCPPDIDVSDATGHRSELSNGSCKLEGGKMDCIYVIFLKTCLYCQLSVFSR